MFAKLSEPQRRSALTIGVLAILATILVGCASQGTRNKPKPFRWSDDSPAWSPNGRAIVFSSDRPAHKQFDLYVVNVDGSHLRRLTDDKLLEESAFFLSNRKIAFMVRGKRYAIGVRGRGRERLLQRKQAAPPIGGWVTFTRTDTDGFDDVYVMRRDGSQKRLVAGNVEGFYPEWSPDRRMFAFSGVINNGSQIYVVYVQRGPAKQLTHDPGVCCPVWSPDGKEIAYQGGGTDPGGSAALIRPDGSDQHSIPGTGQQLDISRITWLRRGQLMLNSGTGVYLINADGSGRRRVAKSANVHLVLSPDQTRVVFEEDGGPQFCPDRLPVCIPRYSRINIIDLITGQLRHLTQN